jgi:phosphohistidine phosphatase
MNLYLVQHGDALSKQENPDRPLSDKGRVDVERVASFLGRSVRVGRVIHSGKTRARDTAVILAGALGTGGVVEEGTGLGPNDATGGLADAVVGWSDDVMVVGHLPFMGRMTARLVAGTEDAAVVAFEPGAVACLESTDDGWAVAWMVRPSLLGGAS